MALLTVPQKFERHFLKAVLFLGFVPLIVFLVTQYSAIAAWKMGDPDDMLRMVQVRDWLAGQSWFDVTQYRMNTPDGAIMHWSRLVDVPLGLVILLTKPIFGSPGAELAAAIIVPMVTYTACFAAICSITKRLFGTLAMLVPAVALWSSMEVLQQIAPMRVDHHGWQMLLFLLCMRAVIADRFLDRAAAAIGAVLALWLNISIEGLPFVAIFNGILALRFIWPGEGDDAKARGRQFAIACTSLAATSVFLFILTHGLRYWTNYCDAVSPAHLYVFVAMSVTGVAGSLLTQGLRARQRVLTRCGVLVVAAVAALSVMRLVAPQCLGDAFANLDPLVRRYWYDRVYEGLPFWKQSVTQMNNTGINFALGAIAAIYIFKTQSSIPLRKRSEILIIFFLSCVMAMLVYRTAVYALLLSMMLIAPLFLGLIQKGEQAAQLAGAMGWRVLATIILLPNIAGGFLLSVLPISAVPNSANEQRVAALEEKILICQEASTTMKLRALPKSQLMATLDASPAILQHTAHKVVASGHHRNQSGMIDVIKAFTLPPSEARVILEKRKIDFLVICPSSTELMVYRTFAPGGLWSNLQAGKTPIWLQRQANQGAYQIWKFDPKVQAASTDNSSIAP
jgi:hypothetical protein